MKPYFTSNNFPGRLNFQIRILRRNMNYLDISKCQQSPKHMTTLFYDRAM
jgi:hypothetical protein